MDLDLKNLPNDASLPKDVVISLLDDLEVKYQEKIHYIDVIHDLSEEEKQCGCGQIKSCIGEEVSEKLDYIPARLQVERHIRLKYACENCEGVEDDGPTVMIAPVPVQLIPKSNSTAGLLAYIAVSKFADAVPLYRQQKIFGRLGIDLSRAVMAKWMVQAASSCAGLIDLLKSEIRGGPLIGIDESPLQVLNEAGGTIPANHTCGYTAAVNWTVPPCYINIIKPAVGEWPWSF